MEIHPSGTEFNRVWNKVSLLLCYLDTHFHWQPGLLVSYIFFQTESVQIQENMHFFRLPKLFSTQMLPASTLSCILLLSLKTNLEAASDHLPSYASEILE